MAEKRPRSEASIISIIREMVKSGESEQTIIKSLQQLGIDPKNAKKLLLLGEADTFALLQSEINKMVKEYFDKEKAVLSSYIKDEIGKTEQGMINRVEKRALIAFREDQKFIENQATMFQARVNQSVKNIAELNEATKRHIAGLGSRISNDERELWSLKERVFGSKAMRIISGIMMAFELGLVASTAYLVFTGVAYTTTDVILVIAIIAGILATMLFLIRIKF